MLSLRQRNGISSCGCRSLGGGWLPAGVAVLCAVAAVASARAEVVIHNGLSAAPSHPFGTDAVDVIFVADVEPAPGLLVVAMSFNEIAAHAFTYAYEDPEPPLLFVDLSVQNLSGVAWSAYEFELTAADYFGIIDGSPLIGDLARANDPVVTNLSADDDILFVVTAGDNISLAGSTIVRDGTNASLSITFDELVDPGESFALGFFIDDVGATDTGFIMSQTPTPIPAPGAVILALVGFGALGPVRHWFC